MLLKKGNQTEQGDAQAVKTSVIAAEIARNHTGLHIGSCANLSNLKFKKLTVIKLIVYKEHFYLNIVTTDIAFILISVVNCIIYAQANFYCTSPVPNSVQ